MESYECTLMIRTFVEYDSKPPYFLNKARPFCDLKRYGGVSGKDYVVTYQ